MADAPGPARPSGDEVTIEERLGPELVARMLAALRNARLYDATNQTLANQIGELHGTILQLLEDELSMISLGQSIYLNGHLVRAPRTAATTFEALSREFESRDLGGFRVHEGVRVQELVVFIKLLASHSDARRAAALPAAMGGAGVTHVSLITTEEVRAFGAAGEAATEAKDERERAKRTYAQAVQGVRGAILRSAKSGRDRDREPTRHVPRRRGESRRRRDPPRHRQVARCARGPGQAREADGRGVAGDQATSSRGRAADVPGPGLLHAQPGTAPGLSPASPDL